MNLRPLLLTPFLFAWACSKNEADANELARLRKEVEELKLKQAPSDTQLKEEVRAIVTREMDDADAGRGNSKLIQQMVDAKYRYGAFEKTRLGDPDIDIAIRDPQTAFVKYKLPVVINGERLSWDWELLMVKYDSGWQIESATHVGAFYMR